MKLLTTIVMKEHQERSAFFFFWISILFLCGLSYPHWQIQCNVSISFKKTRKIKISPINSHTFINIIEIYQNASEVQLGFLRMDSHTHTPTPWGIPATVPESPRGDASSTDTHLNSGEMVQKRKIQ